MKILKTNRGKNVYRVENNADGTLRLLSENGKHEVENAGQIIASLGGIDCVKSLCVEYTQEEFDAGRRAKYDKKRARVEAWKQLHTDSAEAIEAIDELRTLSNGQLEPTEDNIRCVLRLLNKVYFWLWPEKPGFGIGYTAVQYEDLDKEQLCTCIKFDNPVLIYGQQVRKVATGKKSIIPNGYLIL